MADSTLERVEKQVIAKSTNTLLCRFHKTEEYQMFCKDCKDFLCFECLELLHNKHNLCRLKDAKEDIRTEMSVLLFEDKYVKQFNELSENLLEKKKELKENEESLKREIRTSIEDMKHKIDLSEEHLLLELHDTFEGYQKTLQRQETNINYLKTEIDKLEINKLNDFNICHLINTLSEMKVCFSKCSKIIKHPKQEFSPIMEFSVGSVNNVSDGNKEVSALSMPSCSDISNQTYVLEDSDTEWFDAEETEPYDDTVHVESSSDQVIGEYPMNLQLKQDITLIRKILPISEKDAWILTNRSLCKIIDHSFNDIVYADSVDDFVALKDGNVLILSTSNSFIMKLLPNKRLVRFANVGTYDRLPYCCCICKDNSIVIHLLSSSYNENGIYTYFVVRMNTDGIVISEQILYKTISRQPSVIQSMSNSSVCVLYRLNNYSNLHHIEILEGKLKILRIINHFNGIYGHETHNHFECNGMCVNKDDNILISDKRHHSVYVLDKELQFKKTLFDARNGLNEPAAIGLFNDFIWVADGNQIFIFKYVFT